MIYIAFWENDWSRWFEWGQEDEIHLQKWLLKSGMCGFDKT